MSLAFLGLLLGFGMLGTVLPKDRVRTLALNGMWLIALVYPGLFAVLNNRSIYASAGSAASPLLAAVTLAAHAGLVVFGALLLLRVGLPGEVAGQKPMRQAIILYLALQGVIIVAHSWWGALPGWVVVLLVLVVVSSGFETVGTVERRLRWGFRAYVVGSLAAMAVIPDWALVPSESSSRALFGSRDRLIGLTDSSNYMGLVACILFALEVGAMSRGKRFSVLFALAALVACILSQSRTSLLSIGLVSLLYVAYRIGLLAFNTDKGSWAMRLAVAGSVAVPLAVFSSLYLNRQEDLESLTTGRLSIWVWSLREFAEKPVFGHGHSVFTPAYWADNPGYFDLQFANAHNQVLETLVRGGVVEGIGLLAMLLALLGLAMRTRSHPYGITVVLLGITLFTQLMFGTPLRLAGISWNLVQLAAFVAIGVAVLVDRESDSSEADPPGATLERDADSRGTAGAR